MYVCLMTTYEGEIPLILLPIKTTGNLLKSKGILFLLMIPFYNYYYSEKSYYSVNSDIFNFCIDYLIVFINKSTFFFAAIEALSIFLSLSSYRTSKFATIISVCIMKSQMKSGCHR